MVSYLIVISHLLLVVHQTVTIARTHSPTSNRCQALLSTRQLLQSTQLLHPTKESEFYARFRLGKRLGSGSSGVVFSAVDETSSAAARSSLAVKFVQLESSADRRRLVAELTANKRLGVDRGALLLNDSCAALLTPLHPGGSLRQALNRRLRHCQQSNCSSPIVDETTVTRFAVSLLRQLRRLHSIGLVHADIKPENIVLNDPDDIASLTIVDFGSVIGGGVATARTADYAAPELPDAVASPAADIWSAGLVIREILQLGKRQQRRSGNWTPASRQAVDFLTQLTRFRPQDRATAAEALRHPWLSNWRRGVGLT